MAQKVIAINGQFPGPPLNVTTNWNVVVNVHNALDEPLLLTWHGLQHRKTPWQDGVAGTNCPIPAGWNWTYQFQVKAPVGRFFYSPSAAPLHRAAGGYGGIVVNNRDVLPIPFPFPFGWHPEGCLRPRVLQPEEEEETRGGGGVSTSPFIVFDLQVVLCFLT